MLNFGASKPRVKGGPGPPAPLDPLLEMWDCYLGTIILAQLNDFLVLSR